MNRTASNTGNFFTRIALSYRDPKGLKAYPGNPREHPRSQIRKIARNIEEFGFLMPLLIDAEDVIVAGHARLEAALRLELPEVPVVRIDHLAPAEVRALRLADNRLAEEASWDPAKLRIEFEALIVDVPGIELSLTGFEVAEVDRLLVVGEDEEDGEQAGPRGPAVSRPGDLWILGEHLVLCGSALESADYQKMMGEDRATLVLTDPPYNVPVRGHVSGLGAARHEEFAMASGEMSRSEFTAFLTTFMREARAFSRDGALLMCFMDWRHMSEVLAAGEAAFDGQLLNLVAWVKTNAGMGSLYRSRHELVFVFKSGTAPHVNNVALGRHGRYRSNVWTYPGQSSFSRSREKDLADHPTVKPVLLLVDAMLDVTRPGDFVLDPFGGSGSTLLAAERTRRRARLIEIDPRYVDVIIRRFVEQTGREARLFDTGESISQVAARRALETSARRVPPAEQEGIMRSSAAPTSLTENDDEQA